MDYNKNCSIFEKQQKNLKNVYQFPALMGMDKKIGTDMDTEKRETE